MKKTFHGLAFAAAVLLLSACGKKEEGINFIYYSPDEWAKLSPHLNLPELPYDYTVTLPSHMTGTGLFVRPVDDDKATLGRVLFYDKKLSKDGTVSCASCHDQSKGFADNLAFSRGVEDAQTARNSFALASVVNFSAYYGTDLNGPNAVRFFWDNRAETVADQARGSFTNDREMGMHMNEIVNMVRNQEYYAPLFKKAYKDNPVINEANILAAIQDFVNGLGSYRSKFDEEADKKYKSGNFFGTDKLYESFTEFNPSENRGKSLYLQNCSSCHSENMGRPSKMLASNGLDLNPVDKGVGAITQSAQDMGKFKVPTLRNVGLTAPYMHDGRFQTLDEVIEHYSSNIQNHANLDQDLKTGSQPTRFNFSAQDKADLKAFLLTLTDEKLAKDVKFSDPFK